jgi:hypothetical protein
MISTLNLWITAKCQIGLPNYDDPAAKAFLHNLERKFVISPFVDVLGEYIAEDNLQDSSYCSLKLAALAASLRSNQSTEESLLCKYNS